jgi:hypothetical protein
MVLKIFKIHPQNPDVNLFVCLCSGFGTAINIIDLRDYKMGCASMGAGKRKVVSMLN